VGASSEDFTPIFTFPPRWGKGLVSLPLACPEPVEGMGESQKGSEPMMMHAELR